MADSDNHSHLDLAAHFASTQSLKEARGLAERLAQASAEIKPAT
jgi:hypothetical protein